MDDFASIEAAEQSLLGACLLNEKAVLIAGDYVAASDFARSAHAQIWEAMCVLVSRGESIDPVTVGHELRQLGYPLEPGYLHALVAACSTAARVREYARVVAEAALERRVRQSVERALSEAAGSALLERLQADLYTLDRRVRATCTVADVWRQLREEQEPGEGCSYPWPKIQWATRGMRRGWFCVLAGEASHGKTAAALQIAEQALRQGKRVVYLSLEMGPTEIALRLAQQHGFSSDRYYWRRLGADDREVLAKLAQEERWERLILDRVEKAGEIALLLRRWKPDLLVVDHLQLLAGSERVEDLSRTTRALKLVAERFETPLLVLSQLSRPAGPDDAKPRLSRLRGSGTIEQDADTVVFVWRKRLEDEALDTEGLMIVAKSRMGTTGSVPVMFDPLRQRFLEQDQR